MGFFGTVVIFALLLFQIVLVAATRTRTPIHDLLAQTVTVDFASQMIFEDEAALNTFRRTAYAEKSGEMNVDGIYTGTSAISASLVEKSSIATEATDVTSIDTKED